ncbi:protein lsr2 precursor [Mycobacterium antarcticum]|uniref:histone-like nucleoid-structuring protein Lsr2 n=1 Tax=unclassified Mycolicibacterium TaxID=2636767 RepID=UPI002387D132|nr:MULTISPECIES: Lsr2 family protein [unclassified Mycolicibacterium]GLP77067.1 protein lsr2 precursor [Mycolicibacterium sp. TUM20983]GLP82511.1 protein lsr2 precursor [Mycolicibacterium sp. TUM20984]
MGTKKTIVLIDDLDGTPADETIEFGLDGQLYSIELSSDNAEALRRTVRAWADRGRQVGGPRRRHLASVDPWREHVSGQEGFVIREWCNDNGFRVGKRGPLPFGAVDAYRSANAGS